MADVPSSPISKLPLGLLGYLGIKNGGQYPRALGGTYDPSFDMLPIIVGSNFEELNFGLGAVPAVANAGSYSTPLQVPQTEAWYVTMLCHRITTGVGEAWNGYLALRRFPTSSPNVVHALSDVFPASLGASLTGIPQIARPTNTPLILGPGDEVCIFTTAVTGAPQVRPAIRFARLAY